MLNDLQILDKKRFPSHNWIVRKQTKSRKPLVAWRHIGEHSNLLCCCMSATWTHTNPADFWLSWVPVHFDVKETPDDYNYTGHWPKFCQRPTSLSPTLSRTPPLRAFAIREWPQPVRSHRQLTESQQYSPPLFPLMCHKDPKPELYSQHQVSKTWKNALHDMDMVRWAYPDHWHYTEPVIFLADKAAVSMISTLVDRKSIDKQRNCHLWLDFDPDFEL